MPVQILAHNAVHAAFAGYTGVTTGLVNTHYVLLPIPVVISTPRRVSFALAFTGRTDASFRTCNTDPFPRIKHLGAEMSMSLSPQISLATWITCASASANA